MGTTVFTIGHSTHPIDRFVALVNGVGATALCDVRSSPYSRFNPQFNRDVLKVTLREAKIAYVPLGKELGGRFSDSDCYKDGRIQYERVAQTKLFQKGLDRIQEGMKRFRLVLMCAEKEPLDCHRSILVARHLALRGVDVRHIHPDGTIERHEDALRRLMRQLNLAEDMFHSVDDLFGEAYRRQEERIAFTATGTKPNEEADRGFAAS